MVKAEKNYLEKESNYHFSSSIGVRTRELIIRVQELENREHQLEREKENIAEALKAEHDQNLLLSNKIEDLQKKIRENATNYSEIEVNIDTIYYREKS